MVRRNERHFLRVGREASLFCAAHDIIVPDTGCNYYKVEENAGNRRGEKKRKERRLVWMIETLVLSFGRETKISQEFNLR